MRVDAIDLSVKESGFYQFGEYMEGMKKHHEFKNFNVKDIFLDRLTSVDWIGFYFLRFRMFLYLINKYNLYIKEIFY